MRSGGRRMVPYSATVRTGVELKDRLAARAQALVARPDMFAADGSALGAMATQLLGDLCFIDGREDDYEAAVGGLRAYGERGVVGPFVAVFGENGSYYCEVASVYAEVLHRLGYLSGVTPVSDARYQSLTRELRSRFEEVDCRRSEVEAEFGPPSFAVSDTVWCYTSADPADAWVFFDFAREPVMQYEPGKGSYRDLEWGNDPLLRDIRAPASDFESGLILTLYGKVRRWGTGWWIAHEATRSRAPEGVAEQLRAIRDVDPSQALRRPPASGYRPD